MLCSLYTPEMKENMHKDFRKRALKHEQIIDDGG